MRRSWIRMKNNPRLELSFIPQLRSTSVAQGVQGHLRPRRRRSFCLSSAPPRREKLGGLRWPWLGIAEKLGICLRTQKAFVAVMIVIHSYHVREVGVWEGGRGTCGIYSIFLPKSQVTSRSTPPLIPRSLQAHSIRSSRARNISWLKLVDFVFTV